ncbi:hypothetical protein BACUNI_01405 [Bacteroides uniformis ATCC 8492]|uniref:Uncharacterized protein n=1 Tax=Bacteroides uniformis (strain ATCC 8492 / DSM 6597 / CCUG 4942 / CIP 103695 / JCM 5828 / KCTC 5204 / NCTC 13054 / VPI 0061) TaxID=411479 RepID=A0ABC9NE07_BACUC|nr:hypothetical protein BACUNI_01405 [Bacteroides uniformis ATCC 8492]
MRCIAPAMHLIFSCLSLLIFPKNICRYKNNQIILLLIYRNDKT